MNIQVINSNLVSVTLSTNDLMKFEILTIHDFENKLKFHCLLRYILACAQQQGTILESPYVVGIIDTEDGIQMDFCLENPVECSQDRSESKNRLNEAYTFIFRDFEDVVNVSYRLRDLQAQGGILFVYEGKYTLHYPAANQTALALLEEYGERTPVTIHVLKEYGKVLIEDQAVKHLVNIFE